MNKVEKLSKLFGNAATLSACCNVSRTLVTRWKKSGTVPPRYNMAVKMAAADIAADKFKVEGDAREFINQVEACLELSVCPSCGKAIEDHRVI